MESSFALNKIMILLGVVLVPVLLWFFRIKWTKKIILFGVIFLLIFSRGTLELLGVSNTFLRLVLEMLILWIFIKGVFINSKNKKKLPGLFWLLLFMLISFLSVILNELEFMDFILFIRDYLMVFIFFYGVLNMKFNHYEISIINKLIMLLFLSQIAANIIKFLILQDIVEPYIGTMANLGGSLTVIFAMVGTAYTFLSYFVTKKRKYLIFSIGFILFSLLGGKRAVIVFFPFIYLFITLIYQKHVEKLKIRGLRRVILFSIITVSIFFISIRLMPSLNKERKVWGSFDISYALDYSESYITTGAGAIAEVGRFEAPAYLFDLMYGDNAYNFVLGYGAGHLIKSKYNVKLQNKDSQQELTQSLYGVGYGARTAFLQILLQVGIIGLIVFVLLLFSVFRLTKKKYKLSVTDKVGVINYMFLLVFWFIFLLDFFTYSTTVIKLSSISIVFFWVLGHKSYLVKVYEG